MPSQSLGQDSAGTGEVGSGRLSGRPGRRVAKSWVIVEELLNACQSIRAVLASVIGPHSQ